MSKRRNGECSIFAYRNGYAAYAWVHYAQAANVSANGSMARRTTRYTRSGSSCKVRRAEGPVPTNVPTVSHYMNYWLDEVVKPNLAPKTYERYEAFTRLHIVPYLGAKRLDKLQVKDIRQWLNKLAQVCQCCAQGKDAAQPQGKRRCCAIGQCCHTTLSAT